MKTPKSLGGEVEGVIRNYLIESKKRNKYDSKNIQS